MPKALVVTFKPGKEMEERVRRMVESRALMQAEQGTLAMDRAPVVDLDDDVEDVDDEPAIIAMPVGHLDGHHEDSRR